MWKTVFPLSPVLQRLTRPTFLSIHSYPQIFAVKNNCFVLQVKNGSDWKNDWKNDQRIRRKCRVNHFSCGVNTWAFSPVNSFNGRRPWHEPQETLFGLCRRRRTQGQAPDSIAVGLGSVTFPENPVKDPLRRLGSCLWFCSSEQARRCRDHKTIA